MAYTYVQILELGFPTVKAHAFGDGSDYLSLIWDAGDPLPSKAVLDAWVATPTGIAATTAAEKVIADTQAALAANNIVTLTGDITGSGPATISTTLSNSGVAAGTYNSVVVDTKGRVLAGSTLSANSILKLYSGFTSAMSGTSQIPANNSTPTISQGTGIWSAAVVPASTSSQFIINQSFMCDASNSSSNLTVTVFRDSTCIYATGVNAQSSGKPQSITIYTIDSPNTTLPVTYSLRFGTTGGTWYLNQSGGGSINYGGTANKSDWSIMEIR